MEHVNPFRDSTIQAENKTKIEFLFRNISPETLSELGMDDPPTCYMFGGQEASRLNGQGYWGEGSPEENRIQRSVSAAHNQVMRLMYGKLRPAEMVLVINPNTEQRMLDSSEIRLFRLKINNSDEDWSKDSEINNININRFNYNKIITDDQFPDNTAMLVGYDDCGKKDNVIFLCVYLIIDLFGSE